VPVGYQLHTGGGRLPGADQLGDFGRVHIGEVGAHDACVQNAYSLVSRTDEDMLWLCTGAGIAWVPYFPLGGALPGLPKVTEEPAVLAAAGSLRCTPAQVGAIPSRDQPQMLRPSSRPRPRLRAAASTAR
jgi:hypothetical protein